MTNYSIVVITENEESNIQHCINSCVQFCDDVWVVDSYSTDKTREIAEKLGAKVVQHTFESWGAQRNYALDNLQFKHAFILFLDADEQIGEDFAQELERKIRTSQYVAFDVNFDIVFLGKVLRHAHENPPVLRVISKNAGRWVSEGAREYCLVNGPIGRIKARIRHEDRKGIFFWLIKHIRNADREAKLLLEKKHQIKFGEAAKNNRFERRSRVVLRRVYSALPFVIRPFLVFIYRYFIRFGFLDGYPGLVFCFLQAFWYNLIIDVRLFEIRLGHDSYLPTYGGDRK
jgi:glycosyltransferase involved in cell wall biosynthesis